MVLEIGVQIGPPDMFDHPDRRDLVELQVGRQVAVVAQFHPHADCRPLLGDAAAPHAPAGSSTSVMPVASTP
jgi:hypothetical protein